MSLQFPV